MRTLTIELDHLPPRELSLNARVHWAVRAKVMERAKAELVALAKSEWNKLNPTPQLNFQPYFRARISYLFHVKTRRERDYDNLIAGCKPYPDGLKAAGVILNDDIFHCELRAWAKPDGYDGITIIVEEIE